MKINEVLQHRRVNEISMSGLMTGAKNAASAVASVAKDVGKQMAQNIVNPQTQDANRPTQVDYTKDPIQKAQEAANKMVPQITKSMTGAWNTSVQSLKLQYPVKIIPDQPPPKTEEEKAKKEWEAIPDRERVNSLYNQLKAFMTSAMGTQINGFEDLPRWASDDPAVQTDLANVITRIKQDVTLIKTTPPSIGNNQKLTVSWTDLVRNLLTAVNLVKFSPKAGSKRPYQAKPEDQTVTVAGKPFDNTNPEQVAIVKNLADRLP